jgi:hypothetical protein
MTRLKIQRLLKEHSNIIDNMPYGSIIYQIPSKEEEMDADI